MIRSYNNNHKPSHWDEYAQLCEAIIYTTLETLKRRLEFKLCERITPEGRHRFYATNYYNNASEYADAYHFLMSNLFVMMCGACQMDAYKLREKITPEINIDLVLNGDTALAKEKKRQITLNLAHGDVIIEVPYKWHTARIK